MNSSLQIQSNQFVFWSGQKLNSTREVPIGLDTETALIEVETKIPELALVIASDGQTNVVIHPDNLGEFLEMHRDEWFVFHNAAFDFWVIDQHLAKKSHPSQRVLWACCHHGRLFDTLVLDRLIRLAKVSGSEDGNNLFRRSLDKVLQDYSELVVNKDDPYRIRYGELVGLTPSELENCEIGFFEYAIADAIAVHRLYPLMTMEANCCINQFKSKMRQTGAIYHDAFERFGYLTEIIQVEAEIVLSQMFRSGVCVDTTKLQARLKDLQERANQITEALMSQFPETVKLTKAGKPVLTPKSGVVSLSQAAIDKLLAKIMRLLPAGVDIPRTAKSNKLSGSFDVWVPWRKHHPFLELWLELKQLSKQIEMLKKCNSSYLYTKYDSLKSTGRTSCSAPKPESGLPGVNIQNIPKEFRDIFVPRDKESLLAISDYVAIELRTLAAVCLANQGKSKLAEVIKQGIDPHAFTAARILNQPHDEFLQLKTSEPEKFKDARQASKAINFGVPGA